MKYHIDILPYSFHKKTSIKFDDKGVLLTKIPYTEEYHYHLTAIASYCIETGDTSNIMWIIDNLGSDGVYHHDFVFPWYEMERGWVGGLAQGLAISALVKSGHYDIARKVMDGLKKYCMDDNIIYEYPDVEILNGWIYALFGVFDIGDEEFFNDSIKSLKDRLPQYDIFHWSRYDAYNKFPATLFYHKIHIKQMKALFDLTNDLFFYKYYQLWTKNLDSFLSIEYAKAKRLMMIVSKHGIKECIKRYNKRRRWKGG